MLVFLLEVFFKQLLRFQAIQAYLISVLLIQQAEPLTGNSGEVTGTQTGAPLTSLNKITVWRKIRSPKRRTMDGSTLRYGTVRYASIFGKMYGT